RPRFEWEYDARPGQFVMTARRCADVLQPLVVPQRLTRLSAAAFFAGPAQGIGKRAAAGLLGRLAWRRRFRGGAGSVLRRSLLLLLAGLIVKTQCQRNALARLLDLQHLHLDDVAWFDDLARILDESLRHRGDVDQPVLVHADINERA